MSLNWLSLLVFLYLLLGALAGWRRGLVLVAASVIGYIIGLVVAAHVQSSITRWLAGVLPFKQWAALVVPRQGVLANAHSVADVVGWSHMVLGVLVFLIILMLIAGAVRALGQAVTGVVRQIPLVRSANTVGGVVGGVVENMLIVGVILGLLLTLPLIQHGPVAMVVRQSPISVDLVHWVGRLAPWQAEHWLA
ncbi:MAG: CvpA family protein [Thermaerobacter sp.]|nr:CvpA family protein [Thermaerobacter sp.]